MPTETAPETAEALPNDEVYVPEGWDLWCHGTDSTSSVWTERTEDWQTVSTLPSLDRPLLYVKTPVERTYPGLYLARADAGRPNPYTKDLELDVVMPQSLAYLDAMPPQTEGERLAQERARELFERAQNGGFRNRYIPDGEVLVKVAEPPRPDDSSPRRIAYVPLPFYKEYERLREQGTAEQVV